MLMKSRMRITTPAGTLAEYQHKPKSMRSATDLSKKTHLHVVS